MSNFCIDFGVFVNNSKIIVDWLCFQAKLNLSQNNTVSILSLHFVFCIVKLLESLIFFLNITNAIIDSLL